MEMTNMLELVEMVYYLDMEDMMDMVHSVDMLEIMNMFDIEDMIDMVAMMDMIDMVISLELGFVHKKTESWKACFYLLMPMDISKRFVLKHFANNRIILQKETYMLSTQKSLKKTKQKYWQTMIIYRLTSLN